MTCQRFFTCLTYDFLLPARTHVYVCTIPQTATQLARKDIKLSPRTGASQMNCLGERKGAGSSRSASTNEVSAGKKIKLRERGRARERYEKQQQKAENFERHFLKQLLN